MQRADAIFPRAGRGRFVEFSALVGFVGHDLVAQHIQDLVEARSRIDWDGHRKDFLSEAGPNLLEDRLKIGALFVKRVYYNDFRNSVIGRISPNLLGADGDAMLGIHHHQSEVTDAQGSQTFTDEV